MAVRRHWVFGLGGARLALGITALGAPALAQNAAAPPPAAAALPAPTVQGSPATPPVTPLPTVAPVAPVAPSTPAPVPPTAATAPSALPPAASAPEVEPAPAGSLPELPPTRHVASPSEESEAQPAADEPWYDAFDGRVFADAYFAWNFNSPKPQLRENDDVIAGNQVIRAFDSARGFALSWAGLDISHAAQPVGGTVSLRFGPSAKRYNSSCLSTSGKCDANYGLENVKQAFASFRPGGASGPVTIDFGKFDTIYGAEVAESQDNMNYTRGVLYWLGQPAFHTGLRATAELTPNVGLRALIVNGWNNTIDNNSGKTFGLQAIVHAPRDESHDWVSAALGYLGGPERDDTLAVTCAAGSVFDASSPKGCSPGTNRPTSGTVDHPSSNTKGWRHFVDLLVTSDPSDALHVVFNADLGSESLRDSDFSANFTAHTWLGAMLGARYLVLPVFAVAARGEFYKDKDGVTTGSVNGLAITGATISTATLTLDLLPTKNLLVRLDNRLDHSTKQIFPSGVHDDLTGSVFTSTLGVVVTTH